jgi:hypothetical protein
MTRKDYEAAAEMLRKEYEGAQGDYACEVGTAIELFAQFFQQDNPRFNKEQFLQSCVQSSPT